MLGIKCKLLSPFWRQSPFALDRVFLPSITKVTNILNVPKEYLLQVKGIDSKNKNAISLFSFPTYVQTRLVIYITYLANKCTCVGEYMDIKTFPR